MAGGRNILDNLFLNIGLDSKNGRKILKDLESNENFNLSGYLEEVMLDYCDQRVHLRLYPNNRAGNEVETAILEEHVTDIIQDGVRTLFLRRLEKLKGEALFLLHQLTYDGRRPTEEKPRDVVSADGGVRAKEDSEEEEVDPLPSQRDDDDGPIDFGPRLGRDLWSLLELRDETNVGQGFLLFDPVELARYGHPDITFPPSRRLDFYRSLSIRTRTSLDAEEGTSAHEDVPPVVVACPPDVETTLTIVEGGRMAEEPTFVEGVPMVVEEPTMVESDPSVVEAVPPVVEAVDGTNVTVDRRHSADQAHTDEPSVRVEDVTIQDRAQRTEVGIVQDVTVQDLPVPVLPERPPDIVQDVPLQDVALPVLEVSEPEAAVAPPERPPDVVEDVPVQDVAVPVLEVPEPEALVPPQEHPPGPIPFEDAVQRAINGIELLDPRYLVDGDSPIRNARFRDLARRLRDELVAGDPVRPPAPNPPAEVSSESDEEVDDIPNLEPILKKITISAAEIAVTLVERPQFVQDENIDDLESVIRPISMEPPKDIDTSRVRPFELFKPEETAENIFHNHLMDLDNLEFAFPRPTADQTGTEPSISSDGKEGDTRSGVTQHISMDAGSLTDGLARALGVLEGPGTDSHTAREPIVIETPIPEEHQPGGTSLDNAQTSVNDLLAATILSDVREENGVLMIEPGVIPAPEQTTTEHAPEEGATVPGGIPASEQTAAEPVPDRGGATAPEGIPAPEQTTAEPVPDGGGATAPGGIPAPVQTAAEPVPEGGEPTVPGGIPVPERPDPELEPTRQQEPRSLERADRDGESLSRKIMAALENLWQTEGEPVTFRHLCPPDQVRRQKTRVIFMALAAMHNDCKVFCQQEDAISPLCIFRKSPIEGSGTPSTQQRQSEDEEFLESLGSGTDRSPSLIHQHLEGNDSESEASGIDDRSHNVIRPWPEDESPLEGFNSSSPRQRRTEDEDSESEASGMDDKSSPLIRELPEDESRFEGFNSSARQQQAQDDDSEASGTDDESPLIRQLPEDE